MPLIPGMGYLTNGLCIFKSGPVANEPSKARIVMENQFDTQGLGCGQLVFELHKRVTQLAPGERLEVIAHEPSVRIDLMAWCRMTGHTLISDDHPIYMIERKKD